MSYPPSMDDKERVENAKAYLAAKRQLAYAEQELEKAAAEGYPTDETEARALTWPLRDIAEARETMQDCLAKL